MKLGYVILYVQDVAATVSFYENAFGLTKRFVHDSGTYAELETGGTVLAFAGEDFTPTAGKFNLNRKDQPAAGSEIGLVTVDVATGYAQALAAGALSVMPPTAKPWGQTVSYVTDNNGYLVEICSPVG
jgi:lactoylglutathione lyase